MTVEYKSIFLEIYSECYFSIFNKDKNDKHKYFIVKSSVARFVLNSTYIHFLKTKECLPMEELDQEQKNKYWEASKVFFTDKKTRISAAKSMYVLELITGTDKIKLLIAK